MAETELRLLYEQDYYTWLMRTAELIRQGRFEELDADHLADEIEDMGKSTQRELASRLVVLLSSLLKWQHQPDQRVRHGRSWQLTIKEQRRQLAILLRKNPGLQVLIDESVAEAYGIALLVAARESGLAETVFPAVCPFGFQDMMDEDFWPG